MFRDSYLMLDAISQKDNLFTRVDARIKMILGILFLVAVIYLPGIRAQLTLSLIILSAALIVRTPLSLIAVRMMPPLLFGTAVLCLFTISKGANDLFTIRLLGFSINGHNEGFYLGLTIFMKIAACACILLFISISTPVNEIGYALVWLKVPVVIVETLLLTYRFLFVFIDEGIRIKQAQTLRLGYFICSDLANWKVSLKSTATLMGLVLIRAYDRAESVFSAMRVRAYNGQIAKIRFNKWNVTQTWYLASGLCLFILIVGIAF